MPGAKTGLQTVYGTASDYGFSASSVARRGPYIAVRDGASAGQTGAMSLDLERFQRFRRKKARRARAVVSTALFEVITGKRLAPCGLVQDRTATSQHPSRGALPRHVPPARAASTSALRSRPDRRRPFAARRRTPWSAIAQSSGWPRRSRGASR